MLKKLNSMGNKQEYFIIFNRYDDCIGAKNKSAKYINRCVSSWFHIRKSSSWNNNNEKQKFISVCSQKMDIFW